MSSPTMHVYGIVPPDEDWKKMKAVYDACTKAKVAVPSDVDKFLDYEKPDDAGVLIDLTDKCSEVSCPAREMDEVLDLKMSDIPASVKAIRFVISY